MQILQMQVLVSVVPALLVVLVLVVEKRGWGWAWAWGGLVLVLRMVTDLGLLVLVLLVEEGGSLMSRYVANFKYIGDGEGTNGIQDWAYGFGFPDYSFEGIARFFDDLGGLPILDDA